MNNSLADSLKYLLKNQLKKNWSIIKVQKLNDDFLDMIDIRGGLYCDDSFRSSGLTPDDIEIIADFYGVDYIESII